MSSLTAPATPPRRPLFLTGMMGSGKSTLGALLARQWGCPLVDLDARIERMFGAAIPALFAAGEPQFRRCEREALQLLVGEPGFVDRTVVVATGGGVVVDPGNRRAMRAAGLVVFLDVAVDELARRLTAGTLGTRPLLGTQAEAVAARLGELLDQRRSAYEDADVVVDGSGPPQDVAGRLVATLSVRA